MCRGGKDQPRRLLVAGLRLLRDQDGERFGQLPDAAFEQVLGEYDVSRRFARVSEEQIIFSEPAHRLRGVSDYLLRVVSRQRDSTTLIHLSAGPAQGQTDHRPARRIGKLKTGGTAISYAERRNRCCKRLEVGEPAERRLRRIVR